MKFKRLSFFYFMPLLYVMVACSEEIEVENSPDSKYIDFVFNLKPESKAYVDSDGSGSFAEGDEIGLYSYGNGDTKHFKLTYNGSEWLPKMTAGDLGAGNGNVRLCAYYPYNSSVGENIGTSIAHQVNVPSSQEYKSYFNNADLLWSEPHEINSSVSGTVTFNFRHILSKFNINMSGISDSNARIRVYGGQKGVINIDGPDTEFDSSDSSSSGWFEPFLSDPYKRIYSVILFPQYDKNKDFKGDVRVEVSLNSGKSSVYRLSDENLEKIRSGKSFTLNLSKNDGGNNDKYKNAKIWFKGINAPVFPEAPWFINEDGGEKLCYDKSYGWFDCNKRNSIDGVTPDASQCWAAASSNLIHWWLYNNEPYSSRYVEWYNSCHEEKFPDYHFEPLTYEGGGSEIFSYFTKSFIDRGGYVHEGLDWFFSGLKPVQTGHASYPAGFFRDVFPNGIAQYVSGMSKGHFNECIKMLIEKGYAASYSNNGHELSLWGVEFDEEGYVSHAYVCDNNYGEIDADKYGGASCTRWKVTYVTIEGNATQTKIGSSNVVRLFYLPLETEKFAEFVDKHCK